MSGKQWSHKCTPKYKCTHRTYIVHMQLDINVLLHTQVSTMCACIYTYTYTVGGLSTAHLLLTFFEQMLQVRTFRVSPSTLWNWWSLVDDEGGWWRALLDSNEHMIMANAKPPNKCNCSCAYRPCELVYWIDLHCCIVSAHHSMWYAWHSPGLLKLLQTFMCKERL